MNLQGKRVLVTGGSGFIGAHLTERLANKKINTSIIVKNKPNVNNDFSGEIKAYECDLLNFERLQTIIREVSPDIVFHLAGLTSPERNLDPELAFKNNFTLTFNLLRALNGNFEHFINTGTCEEYGNGETPFVETQSPKPVSPYSASKVASTYYCQMLYSTQEFPITTLRPFLTYGPRQRNIKMLIPATILSVLNKSEFKMTKGEQTRDFVYVADIVDAYLAAAGNASTVGEIINIGSGKEYRVVDVVYKIIQLMGSELTPRIGTIAYRKGETMHFYGDNSKAKKLLNWEPKVNLEDGLKETIKWYAEKFNSRELEDVKRE